MLEIDGAAGELRVRIEPVESLRPLMLSERGELVECRATVSSPGGTFRTVAPTLHTETEGPCHRALPRRGGEDRC